MKIGSWFRPTTELGQVQKNSTETTEHPSRLDLSHLHIPVAGPGEPGPVALLNSSLRPGKISAPFLLIGEFKGDLANTEFEAFTAHANLGVISIRADQFDGKSEKARAEQFFNVIDDLFNQKLIDEDTEIYVNLHGIAEGKNLFIGTSDNLFRVEAHALLNHLRRSRNNTTSKACTYILCCQSKILHEQVKDFPHSFFFLSGQRAIFDDDAYATAKELFKLSCRHPDAPPHPELVLKEASLVSGENPTLAGHGVITTVRLKDFPAEEIKQRSLQVSRHLDAKLEHGSFKSYAQLLNKYGIQSLLQKPGQGFHLFNAIECSKDPFLKMMFLIALGENVNPPGQRDRQLLHIACEENDPDLIRLLLENSADPTQKNKNGLTVRELALSLEHDEIIEALDTFSKGVRFPECSILNFVEAMIRTDEIEIINILEQKSGFFWKLRRNNGDSMITYAVREKKYDILKLLLKDQSSLAYARNDNGNTPLHLACIRGDMMAVSMLIHKKLALSSTNKRGYTPLIYAARRGHLDPIRAMHGAGADVNHQSLSGKTALHHAVEKNQPEIVQELLRLGVDASIRDNKGKSALALATKKNNTVAIMMLSTPPIAETQGNAE